VDVDGAEKIGVLHEVILDPAALRVAGLAVSGGVTFIGAQKQMLLPSSAVHAIGPDAVMVRRPPLSDDTLSYLSVLPRVSDLAGRRLVSDTGTLVGSVCDVIFDSQDGRLIGYEFKPPNGSASVEKLLGVGRGRPLRYVRAEASLRIGTKLIVVPEDAVVDAVEPDIEEDRVAPGRWHDVSTEDPTRELVLDQDRKAS